MGTYLVHPPHPPAYGQQFLLHRCLDRSCPASGDGHAAVVVVLLLNHYPSKTLPAIRYRLLSHLLYPTILELSPASIPFPSYHTIRRSLKSARGIVGICPHSHVFPYLGPWVKRRTARMNLISALVRFNQTVAVCRTLPSAFSLALSQNDLLTRHPSPPACFRHPSLIAVHCNFS
ncbi:uncharacterized protein LY79DRAFT_548421 [Colletotrichum navitas]|uniref:Uncharacterized protein n=1 Tax=Colletotrichum navitas TaxID=681940 RepID=A0AAD8Q491_9PEZI|nr:uncharacterized protein LY79DRAFT_548421 [Colletotrichum navitas]KAK1594777.1 hypothetical protein LY79DRAFT_548421 [Colletotrichum navitas]